MTLTITPKKISRVFLTNACGFLSTSTLRRLTRMAKQTHPSADRNSQPIADALCSQVDKQTPNLQLIEVAAGSGQHVGFLAPLLPNIHFQPTEFERYHFASIRAYAADCVTKNISDPVYVDIALEMSNWPPETLACIKTGYYDYMFNSNMLHITPWACSVGLFRAAGQLLKPGGTMFTYGPYAVEGQLTPQSNANFDDHLRKQNRAWGVRDIRDLKQLGEIYGLSLSRVEEMPSNNKFLTWIKL